MSSNWRAEAECAKHDPETFFLDPEMARAVCRPCPVRQTCLDYALEHDLRFGVWGGLTEDERARMRRPDGHGTPAGAQRHRDAGESLCHRCAAALSWAERRDRESVA